jgi:hypothetical protein
LKLVRRSKYQELFKDSTYNGLVLAKSKILEKLCRDMATAIKKTLAGKR